MTVKISKPAINVREELADLKKPTGIAGEAMLRAETPQEQFNLIGAGRRNLIINGAMQVWQRGVNFSSSAGAYIADRWYVDNTGGGTSGQSTDAPDDFAYSFRVNPSSTTNAAYRQAIELPAAGVGGIFRSGNSFTLSFYLKSDNAGEAINVFVASSSVVTGTTTIHVNDASTGLVTSTSWTRYTYTFDCKDVGGSDTCFNVVPYVTSPSDYTYLTGVQLELGKVATPFEHRSYGEELALCQRYYYRIDSAYNNANYQRFAVVNIESGTEAEGFFTHPVEMRAIPALGFSAASDFHVFTANVIRAISVLYIDQSSPTTAGVAITSTGMTAGNVGLLNADNNKDAFIEFKAEL